MKVSQRVRHRFTPVSPVINEALDSRDSVDESAETVPTTHKPPTSMPIPAAPRRAVPPRRKKESPKQSVELPTEEETVVPEAKVPLPEFTSNLLEDAEGDKNDAQSDADLKPAPAVEPSPPVEDESRESSKDMNLVIERSTSPILVKSVHHDVPEDARPPSPVKEDQPATPLSEEKLAELVEEGQKDIEERSGIDQPEQDLEEPLAEVSKGEEPPEHDRTVDGEDELKVFTPELDAVDDKPREQPKEEEEDEAARRASITARLANSGGFNPFAGGPPIRKPSGSSLSERRTSSETPSPFKSTLREEQESPAQPLARRDVDSPHDETGLSKTEENEEDEPFDTLKRVEGDS